MTTNRLTPDPAAAPPMPELAGHFQVQDWAWQAVCAGTDPEAFFPEKGGSTRDAQKICISCEVRTQCLQYALEHDERFGIWGGKSDRERRQLKESGGSVAAQRRFTPSASSPVRLPSSPVWRSR